MAERVTEERPGELVEGCVMAKPGRPRACAGTATVGVGADQKMAPGPAASSGGPLPGWIGLDLRWLRILSITAGSRMTLMICSAEPHLAQVSVLTS